MQLVKGDIQSSEVLNETLRNEDIDTVMHFAAQVCTTRNVISRHEECAVLPSISLLS